jgi:sulfatase maturation enzyme AslB (radical SAM superfamily)
MEIPKNYNYIGIFLTLRCNFNCPHCINDFDREAASRSELSGEQWLDFLNQIESRQDLPITLQGGEPSIHKNFYEIINGIKYDLKIDLISNLSFNLDRFINSVNPVRLKRDAKYSSIRTTFYPDQTDTDSFLMRVRTLKNSGYSIGVWLIDHPHWSDKNTKIEKVFIEEDIDVRHKNFLGVINGKLYGAYKYPEGLNNQPSSVECRTTELLVAPDGYIFKCHSDLYGKINPIGSIFDKTFIPEFKFRKCSQFGKCNPCDLKTKFNRFQEMGHCSVEIQ